MANGLGANCKPACPAWFGPYVLAGSDLMNVYHTSNTALAQSSSDTSPAPSLIITLGAEYLPTPPTGEQVPVRRFWTVLDPTLRVLAVIPFTSDGSDRERLFRLLDDLPEPSRFAGIELQAPILFLPNVFEPEFCRHLVGLYEQHGGVESGFMLEVDGKTVPLHDHTHKRRKDYTIGDPELIKAAQARTLRRVVPEILKVHHFNVTRMERYIVSCYAAEDEAHFRAHRDNTTKGTAHRRFAVSINLNSDFEGSEVSFPEYGSRSFKAPI